MERKTGFEPATSTLARWRSTGLSYFRSSEAARKLANPGAVRQGEAAAAAGGARSAGAAVLGSGQPLHRRAAWGREPMRSAGQRARATVVGVEVGATAKAALTPRQFCTAPVLRASSGAVAAAARNPS